MSRSFFTLVKNAFTNYPIATNAVVYGTLYVGAEFSQQALTRKVLNSGTKTQFDLMTMSRYAVIGVGVNPPVYYYWYRWLDSKFMGTSVKVVTRKLLLDQFLFTPPLLVMFFVAMSIMEKRKDIMEECTKKIVPTFKTSCMFWLPAQTVNFFLIPATFRVAYVGTCAFAWVNILCWIKRQEY